MASAVLSIQAEIESSRLRLQQVLTRLELAERSALEAGRNIDCSSNINEGPSQCGRSVDFDDVGVYEQDDDQDDDQDDELDDGQDSRDNDFQSLPAEWQYW